MSFLYFLLLIGVLVVIHELGHFAAAKALDFKVLRFSLGFGRPLVRVSTAETEYQLCIFPLGGYVRILGEDDSDPIPQREALRAFSARPLWQRLIVVFAGPAANLLFPVLIYFALYAGHTQLPAAVIGDVIDNSPAARAGLQPGDRLLSINGEPVRYWEEVVTAVDGSVGDQLSLRIRRGHRDIEKLLAPVERVLRERDGRRKHQGWIGVSQAPFRPQIAVVDRGSPAGRAGLRTGDLVVSVDGRAIDNWTALNATLRANPGRRIVAYFRSTAVPGVRSVRLLDPGVANVVPDSIIDVDGKRSLYTGVASGEMLVTAVVADSPAERAGLRAGDLITSLNGEPTNHWMQLDQDLQANPDRTWVLQWQRAGDGQGVQQLNGSLTQELRAVQDEYGNRNRMLMFGATNDFEKGQGVQVDIDGRFSYAATKSMQRTGDTVVQMTLGFWSILRGETPREAVGGPLMMYRVASVSGARGWESFLIMLALISINLGLINILPVPMLDGGQLLVIAIESVTRKRLTRRTRERIMLVGLLIVICITILALSNDVMRYIL